jgi:hypothetical protein
MSINVAREQNFWPFSGRSGRLDSEGRSSHGALGTRTDVGQMSAEDCSVIHTLTRRVVKEFL